MKTIKKMTTILLALALPLTCSSALALEGTNSQVTTTEQLKRPVVTASAPYSTVDGCDYNSKSESAIYGNTKLYKSKREWVTGASGEAGDYAVHVVATSADVLVVSNRHPVFIF